MIDFLFILVNFQGFFFGGKMNNTCKKEKKTITIRIFLLIVNGFQYEGLRDNALGVWGSGSCFKEWRQ